MEISGSSAFYSGLSTIQAGQNRVDQAAGKIASAATSQPSDAQNDRLQAVIRRIRRLAGGSTGDFAGGLVDAVLPGLNRAQA